MNRNSKQRSLHYGISVFQNFNFHLKSLSPNCEPCSPPAASSGSNSPSSEIRDAQLVA